MKVIKRNGEIRPFDFTKIENAINGAFKECRREKAPETFIKKLRRYFPEETEDRTFTVEELQDIVVTELMRVKFGPFDPNKGGLSGKTTNQVMFQLEYIGNTFHATNITYKFRQDGEIL